MKKIIITILIMLFFIPFIVNAETCDTDKITIESITLENKSDNVEELSEATATGKNISIDLSMLSVGDSIEYNLLIKNDSNEDYTFDDTSLNLGSDYIDYSFEAEDNSNIVKANSSKNITLMIKYNKEVPEDKFENGPYFDNKTLKVNLSNGQTITVPNTIKNSNIIQLLFFVILLLIISVSLYIIFKKKKYGRFIALLIGIAIIIPISVQALCKCEIEIVSKITIDQESFTGVIYRYNENSVTVGDSIRPKGYWIIEDTEDIVSIGLEFESKSECEEEKENQLEQGWVTAESNLICKKYIRGAGAYKLSASELNKSYYIRDEVVNNIITKAQVCFITDKEVCLNNPDDEGSNYQTESETLLGETDWFESNDGTCNYYSSYKTECTGAGFNTIYIGFMTGYSYIEGLDYFQCTTEKCFYNEVHY